MSSHYTQVVQAIVDKLSTAPELSTVKKVYAGDMEVIALFPAISVELRSRTKEVRGIGGLTDTVCLFNIWVYTNKPSYQSALEELEGIVENIEKVLTQDRTLGRVVDNLRFNGEAEFGQTNRGDSLLQTALVQVSTRKLGVSV